MDKDATKNQDYFRYILVMYIILFVLTILSAFILIPNVKENFTKYRIKEHYILWRNKKENKGSNFYTIVLFNNGDGVEVERRVSDSSSPLLSIIEATLTTPTKNEEERGLVSYIPKGTKLVGASYDDGLLYIELSEEFLSSTNLTLAISQIKKTLSLYYRVEHLTIISSDRIFKM